MVDLSESVSGSAFSPVELLVYQFNTMNSKTIPPQSVIGIFVLECVMVSLEEGELF